MLGLAEAAFDESSDLISRVARLVRAPGRRARRMRVARVRQKDAGTELLQIAIQCVSLVRNRKIWARLQNFLRYL